MPQNPFEKLEEEIKKIPIEDIISDYISLKKEGSGYTSLCPFHSEKTPSFKVSPHKGIWKCFGCGKGGDAIQFVAEYENISRKEAMLKLAEKYNLSIPTELKRWQEKQDKTTIALEKLLNFYKEKLLKHKEAIRYLRDKRHLSSKTIEEFELGYAPTGLEAVEFAKKEGIYEELVKLGHFKQIGDKVVDIFRGRVIIPVRNHKGKLVGFTGRAINESQKIKYLHAPYLKKSEILFGLDKALKDGYLNHQKFLILTEGVFDVMKMHQLGFRTTVAVMGAGLAEKQLQLVAQLYSRETIFKVLLAYDNDEAGKRAVLKDWEKLYGYGVIGVYLFRPKREVKDLDELTQVENYRQLKERLEISLSSKSALPFLYAKKVNLLKEPEKIDKAIKMLRRIIFRIPDKTVAKNLWEKVKSFFNHRESFKRIKNKNKPSPIPLEDADFVKHACRIIKLAKERGIISEAEYSLWEDIFPLETVDIPDNYKNLPDFIVKSSYNYILSVYEEGFNSIYLDGIEPANLSFSVDKKSKESIVKLLKKKL